MSDLQRASLLLGAMSNSIFKQLKDQGVIVNSQNRKLCAKAQKIADSITTLSVHGFLTKKETHKKRQKLINMIDKEWAFK
jgi:GTP cyclohydrolase I